MAKEEACKGLLEGCAKHDVSLLCLQGVIVYFRVVDGELKPGDTIRLINTGKEYEVDEVGVLSPKQIPVRLSAGLSTASTLVLIGRCPLIDADRH